MIIFSRQTKDITDTDRKEKRTLIAVRSLEKTDKADKKVLAYLPNAEYELAFQVYDKENLAIKSFYANDKQYKNLLQEHKDWTEITEKAAQKAEMQTIDTAINLGLVDFQTYAKGKERNK